MASHVNRRTVTVLAPSPGAPARRPLKYQGGGARRGYGRHRAPLASQDPRSSEDGKKKATSTAAFSSESEAWMAFRSLDSA